MKLHYKKLGQENHQPLIILHGLFGSLDNWISLAKYFAEHFEVYLVDQRNHGKSPHSPNFSYQHMADDLQEFITDYKIENPIILGHSMGGKTAMLFACLHPNLVKKLIIVDIAPKTYPVHHDSIIESLKKLPLNKIKKRSEAEEMLSKYILEKDVRQFLLKNLTRDDNGNYQWKMNLPIIAQNIEIIGYGLPDNAIFNKDTLFIRGLKSKYIVDDDMIILKRHFPNSTLASVEDAGHWVHAEAPQILYDLVLKFSKSG